MAERPQLVAEDTDDIFKGALPHQTVIEHVDKYFQLLSPCFAIG